MPITKKCPYVENLDNPDTWLCFGGEADRSACTGDSGGPVMVEENGRWTLAGIIAGIRIHILSQNLSFLEFVPLILVSASVLVRQFQYGYWYMFV